MNRGSLAAARPRWEKLGKRRNATRRTSSLGLSFGVGFARAMPCTSLANPSLINYDRIVTHSIKPGYFGLLTSRAKSVHGSCHSKARLPDARKENRLEYRRPGSGLYPAGPVLLRRRYLRPRAPGDLLQGLA